MKRLIIYSAVICFSLLSCMLHYQKRPVVKTGERITWMFLQPEPSIKAGEKYPCYLKVVDGSWEDWPRKVEISHEELKILLKYFCVETPSELKGKIFKAPQTNQPKRAKVALQFLLEQIRQGKIFYPK